MNHLAFGPRLAAVVKRLNALLSGRLAGSAIVSVQDPIQLDEINQPQPDLAVLTFRSDFYGGTHPGSEDVLLVVEVAETSLEYDRQQKIPLYAHAGIPKAWLVDAIRQTITQHTGPEGPRYQDEQMLGRGQTVAFAGVAGLQVTVDEVFG